jgi:PTH2 family peptidyl-tRNA hydrolase
MIKQVIVVRTDLNMRKGKMVAQGAHASLGVFVQDVVHDSDSVIDLSPSVLEWLRTGQTKICVGVYSEEGLMFCKERAEALHLPHYLVLDEGRTEFNGVATYTALAIGPADTETIDKITGHLKLL